MGKNNAIRMYAYKIFWPTPDLFGRKDIPQALEDFLDNRFEKKTQILSAKNKHELLISDYHVEDNAICGIFWVSSESISYNRQLCLDNKQIYSKLVPTSTQKPEDSMTICMPFCIGQKTAILLNIIGTKAIGQLSYYLGAICGCAAGSEPKLTPSMLEKKYLKLSQFKEIIIGYGVNSLERNDSTKILSNIMLSASSMANYAKDIWTQKTHFILNRKTLQYLSEDDRDTDVLLSRIFSLVDDPNLVTIKTIDGKKITGGQLARATESSLTKKQRFVQNIGNLYEEMYTFLEEVAPDDEKHYYNNEEGI